MIDRDRYDDEYVRSMLAQKAKELGSQKALAEMAGVSSTFVSDVLAKRREPTGKLLALINLKRVVSYEPFPIKGVDWDIFNVGSDKKPILQVQRIDEADSMTDDEAVECARKLGVDCDDLGYFNDSQTRVNRKNRDASLARFNAKSFLEDTE